jgi:iron complex outermembrane receptor protein
LRGSYGEAFKAPTAFDLCQPRVSFPSSALDPSRANAPSEFIETFGGNSGLAPETGKSVSIGLVWEPSFAPGLRASLNEFRLEQEDFITTLSADLILANEALFPSRVVRAPPGPADPPGFAGQLISVDTSNINFGKITVKGADLQLEYAFPASAYGEFVSTLAGTYIDEFKILVTPGTEPINQVSHANDAGYPVRFKGNAGLSWSGLSGWSAAATARYLASYTDYDGVRKLPSQTLLDLQMGYRFGSHSAMRLLEGLETTAGVINLTDNQGHFSNNFAGYDSQQMDIRGRFYYVNLKARF